MIDGFHSVLPRCGDIVISQEAATYQPEMEWMTVQLRNRHCDCEWRVVPAENYEPQDGRDVYRFFELFDLPNIPNVDNLLRANAEGRLRITPPIKPYLEEKMWFALFWMQAAARILATRAGRQNTFCNYKKPFPTHGCSIRHRCHNTPSFRDWRFMIGARRSSSVRKSAIYF
jgi:hypothetical protein